MARHRSNSYSSIAERVLLQPWFLPQRIAFAIHALVPPDYWNKMRNFFDDYGCMVCGKESGYHSNGMCKGCYDKTRKKLAQSVKRRLEREPKRRLDFEIFRQEKLAKKLLGRFSRSRRSASQRPCMDMAGRNNPVYEALCARFE